MLVAKNIHKRFYRPTMIHVLRGVDLQVKPGETIAITGASGEGKSTLLQILGTLTEPSEGSIEIDGTAVTASRFSELRRHTIGFIFQSYHLLEDLSVLDNVLMPARIARIDRKEEAFGLLEKVGLIDRANFCTRTLSGGEKQRVAIARALCNGPKILLADEPTGNLDRENSRRIQELLLQVCSQINSSLVIATHDIELAQNCDRIIHLEKGQVGTSS